MFVDTIPANAANPIKAAEVLAVTDPPPTIPIAVEVPKPKNKAGRSKRLELNLEVASRFMRALDPDRSDLIFQTFVDEKAAAKERLTEFDHAEGKRTKKRVNDLSRPLNGTLEKLATVIANYQNHGAAVAVAVNRMVGRNRARGAVAKISSIYADADKGLRSAWPIEPSAIVESSPGRFHVYWFVSGDLGIAQFDGIMRRLVEDFDHDPNCCDPSRAMRLPGTWHLKDPDNPFQVKLIECHEGRRYTAAELMAAFPGFEAPARLYGEVDPSKLPADLQKFRSMLKFISPDNRETWRNVLFGMHHEGQGDPDWLAVVDEWSSDSHKHIVGEVAEIWSNCKPNGGVTGGTITKLAKEGGWVDPRPKRKRKSSDGNGGPSVNVATAQGTSDHALAEAFVARHGRHTRFDHGAKRYLQYQNGIWRPDDADQTRALLRNVLIEHGVESATKLGTANTFVMIDGRIAVPGSVWDHDPWMLGTPDGVVDLRTGNAIAPNPNYYVSKTTAVSPMRGEPKLWLKFLARVTASDTAQIRYIQQIFGYFLTGSTREHCLFFIYGAGGNGKGVLLETLAGLMGDYAWKAASRTLMAAPGDRHLSELAAFNKRRFVYASETKVGQQWDTARICELTGGDTINANHMRRDPISFVPTHKIAVMGNNAPALAVIDDSIKRRFKVLPFDISIPKSEIDRDLPEKLKAEWPQILRWCIEGCLDWQHNKFVVPSKVEEATEQYFRDQDPFGDWLEECCERGYKYQEGGATLLASFNRFLEARGLPQMRGSDFAERMRRAGFKDWKSDGVKRWKGLRHDGEGR